MKKRKMKMLKKAEREGKGEGKGRGKKGRIRKEKSDPPENSSIIILEVFFGGRINVIMILDIILVDSVVYGLCLFVSYLIFSFNMWVRLITGLFVVLFTCHMASFCAYTVQSYRIGEIRSQGPVRLIQVSALTFSIMGFLFSVSACFFATKSIQMRK